MPMKILSKIQRRIRSKDSSRKTKLAQDLLHYRKCVEHGFPHKPTAIAYDPKLKLVAIGTKTGTVKVYGSPGVEVSGSLGTTATVTHLYFLPEQGRIISIDSDNKLNLWEINVKNNLSVLDQVKECGLEEGRSSQISVCAVTANADLLLIGTEGGNLYQLDIPNFTVKEQVIYQDAMIQNVSDDYKLNPGAVEAIVQHPTDEAKFLVGFNKGLILLWDNSESKTVHTYHVSQQLESLDWHRDGTQFISAHNDGSYIIWNANAEQENEAEPIKPPERSTTPYGPFPCKAISRILWKTAKDAPFIVLSGGMPRASYGERHTVSVIQDSTQVVFDITSRIIDFFTIDASDEEDGSVRAEYDAPHSLVILAEEELIVVDLSTEGWPTFQMPYLSSMHSSAFTCAHHVSNVPETLWNKITDAGAEQMKNAATRDWPVTGGSYAGTPSHTRDLLLTGHEDGTIRFWDATNPDVQLLYKLNTAVVFDKDDVAVDQINEGDDEWPPFRKVGTFDPYSDDPRLGIQKLSMCVLSETLVVGGSAGQVIVLQMERESRTFEVSTTVSNIVNDRDNFEWKGHEPLKAQTGDITFATGFQPLSLLQMSPPAACSALTLQPEWQLIASGTAHGFTVFDYAQKKEVSTKCTLNPQEHVGETGMSRSAKFKQSLRDSVRRIRSKRRAGQKQPTPKESPKKTAAAAEAKSSEVKTDGGDEETKKTNGDKGEAGSSGGATTSAAAATTPTEASQPEAPPAKKSPVTTPTTESKPIERKVEARSVDDSNNSVVRTLAFADTFILDGAPNTPSLWAGTNGGLVFVYKITVPETDKRGSEDVKCELCKEIKLRHRAPVIAVVVLDKSGSPLPAPFDVQNERAKSPDMSGQHTVLICSEEQLKVFSLPLLKAKLKVKITAHDGSRLRKIGLVHIRSKNDEEYLSYGMATLSNQGDVSLYNIPQLDLQSKHSCIRREDVQGITSCLFSRYAEGFYLGSPSEYVRFSLTAWQSVSPDCVLELKEGMRPTPPEPEPEAETANATAAAEVGEEAKADEAAAEAETKDAEDGDAEDAEYCKVDNEEPVNITLDSVKEYMTSSEQGSSSFSSTSIQSKKTVTQLTELKSVDGGEVQVVSTTTTRESVLKAGADPETDVQTSNQSSSSTTTYTATTTDDSAALKTKLLMQEEAGVETNEHQNGIVSEEPVVDKLEELQVTEN